MCSLHKQYVVRNYLCLVYLFQMDGQQYCSEQQPLVLTSSTKGNKPNSPSTRNIKSSNLYGLGDHFEATPVWWPVSSPLLSNFVESYFCFFLSLRMMPDLLSISNVCFYLSLTIYPMLVIISTIKTAIRQTVCHLWLINISTVWREFCAILSLSQFGLWSKINQVRSDFSKAWLLHTVDSRWVSWKHFLKDVTLHKVLNWDVA